MIPCGKLAGVYSPTTLSIVATFKASERHNPPSGQYAVGVAAVGNDPGSAHYLQKSMRYLDRTPHQIDRVPHEATLMCIYEDSITVSSGSAGVSSTLFSESSLKRAPQKKQAPGLDGIQM